MAKKNTDVSPFIDVSPIEYQEAKYRIIGEKDSPLIVNRFSQKAWRELLYPSERKSRASLEQSLKHDPLAEFRGGAYRNRDEGTPTLFHLPNGMFHKSMAQVAIDIPGAARTQIERLTRVVNLNVELYGVPQMFMSMVRNSDIGHTPDVRTRPIFPKWACEVTIRYVRNRLTETTITRLLSGAGMIVGVGDWRGEKGGPFGAYRIAGKDDVEFEHIVKTMGRKPQQAAYDNPIAYDADTEDLYSWFCEEVKRRERNVPSSKSHKTVESFGVVDVYGGGSSAASGTEHVASESLAVMKNRIAKAATADAIKGKSKKNGARASR